MWLVPFKRRFVYTISHKEQAWGSIFGGDWLLLSISDCVDDMIEELCMIGNALKFVHDFKMHMCMFKSGQIVD